MKRLGASSLKEHIELCTCLTLPLKAVSSDRSLDHSSECVVYMCFSTTHCFCYVGESSGEEAFAAQSITGTCLAGASSCLLP
eukprot:7790002-Pyramimonas_sp.AAC.1